MAGATHTHTESPHTAPFNKSFSSAALTSSSHICCRINDKRGSRRHICLLIKHGPSHCQPSAEASFIHPSSGWRVCKQMCTTFKKKLKKRQLTDRQTLFFFPQDGRTDGGGGERLINTVAGLGVIEGTSKNANSSFTFLHRLTAHTESPPTPGFGSHLTSRC